jgi:hypothetical protein
MKGGTPMTESRNPMKPSIADKKAARLSAETAAMAEVRHAAQKQRLKTEKLKELRLERDAALPVKKKTAARKVAKSEINLAQTQRIAKK